MNLIACSGSHISDLSLLRYRYWFDSNIKHQQLFKEVKILKDIEFWNVLSHNPFQYTCTVKIYCYTNRIGRSERKGICPIYLVGFATYSDSKPTICIIKMLNLKFWLINFYWLLYWNNIVICIKFLAQCIIVYKLVCVGRIKRRSHAWLPKASSSVDFVCACACVRICAGVCCVLLLLWWTLAAGVPYIKCILEQWLNFNTFNIYAWMRWSPCMPVWLKNLK